MALYWVGYDLDKPGQNYDAVIKRLQQLAGTKIMLSDWLVPHNNTTPASLRDYVAVD